MSKSTELSRREFMKDAAMGAVVWSCITVAGAEEAWSQAVKEQMKITLLPQIRQRKVAQRIAA